MVPLETQPLIETNRFEPSNGKHATSKSEPNIPISLTPNVQRKVAIKLLVLWIYLDAGGGKYMDPKQGWTYNADPLPALDTYTRHTVAAQYIYGILGPQGLRTLTPIVVYIELLSAPVAFIGAYLGSETMVKFAIAMICQLHFGISFSIRNAVLLSYVACAAWCVFLPIGWNSAASTSVGRDKQRSIFGLVLSTLLIGSLLVGNVWYEMFSTDCSAASQKTIWSTLLQNRWNVFIGAEEYVTW